MNPKRKTKARSTSGFRRRSNEPARRRKRNEPGPRRRTYRMKSRGAAQYRRRRKSNPPMRHFRRRRSNPGLSGIKSLAIRAFWATIGGMATRTLPGMVLSKSANSGWMGYLANGVTAWVLSWAGGRWISTEAGDSMLLGGIVMTLARIVEDFGKIQTVSFAPIPGVPQLAGDPKYDFRGMRGEFRDVNFPVPTSSLPGGRPAPALVCPSPEAAAAKGMKGMGSPWRAPWAA